MISISKNTVSIETKITNTALSDFFKDIDEGDRDQVLEDLLVAALTVRNALSIDLETATIKRSVDEAKNKLEEHFEQIKEAISEHVEEMTNPDDGIFKTLFDDAAKNEFENALDPETDGTPINVLKQNILEKINNLSQDLDLVMQKLRIKGLSIDARKRGTDFEKSVMDLFDEIAFKFLDTPQRTGESHEAGSNAKKGDGTIVVHEYSSDADELRIAIEVKTDKQFKKLTGKDPSRLANDDKIKSELKDAIKNRKAQVGIFVIDDQDLDMQSQVRWKLLAKNQLMVVLDSASPDLNYIELAYAWARWQLAKEAKETSTSSNEVTSKTFDPSFIEEELGSLVTELDSSRSLKLSFTGLQSALSETQKLVFESQASLASKIRNLLGEIGQEKALSSSQRKKNK